MSLLDYWPDLSDQDKFDVLKIDADDIETHLLLAVHEPMYLFKTNLNKEKLLNNGSNFGEHDFLEDFISSPRLYPIIGRAGVGKSHLIRWIDAKLKTDSRFENWHIVRIPKNVSLHQMLGILIEGLDNRTPLLNQHNDQEEINTILSKFSGLKNRIKNVGATIQTEVVAQQLILHVKISLQEMCNEIIQGLEAPNISVDEQQKLEREFIHVNDAGLIKLINDAFFSQFLLQEDHSFYQLAKRITLGASSKELEKYDYKITEQDLNFEFNLADIALPGRVYIGSSQFNTNPAAKALAVEVFNEAINRANRNLFNQLFFNVNNESFQDLFKDIRKILFIQKRELVILVEDLSCISSIEKILSDSLLDQNEGNQNSGLCKIRSAIAVTDDYEGYRGRRDSIVSRLGYEWNIDSSYLDNSDSYDRFISFCARYLNATRWGSAELKKQFENKQTNDVFPEKYKIDGTDELMAFDSFDEIPLFPFNKNAIKYFVNLKCKDQSGNLNFNPRDIISFILKEVLLNRKSFEKNNFPSFDLKNNPFQLKVVLQHNGITKLLQKAVIVSEIWGDKPTNLDELKARLPPQIATVFDLSQLAVITGQEPPKVQSTEPPKVQPTEPPTREVINDFEIWCNEHRNGKNFIAWLSNEELLSQDNARALRHKLKYFYDLQVEPTWSGLKLAPSLTISSINIPQASVGNKTENVIEFCKKDDLYQGRESTFYTSTAESLIRHNFYNSTNDNKGWSYPDGYKDFCRIQNFTEKWVPEVLNILKQKELEKLPDFLSNHIEQAYELGLINPDNTLTEKINVLLKDATELSQYFMKKNISKTLQEKLIDLSNSNSWQVNKDNWLNLVSAGENYGYDGDKVERVVKECFKKPSSTSINYLWQKTSNDLRILINKFECFSDIESASNFETAMQNCSDLINEIRNSGENWSNVIGDMQIVENFLIEITSKKGFWQPISILMPLSNDTNNSIKNIYTVHQIDVEKINKISELLTHWEKIYSGIYYQVTTRNTQLGGNLIVEAENKINELIEGYQESFRCLEGTI